MPGGPKSNYDAMTTTGAAVAANLADTSAGNCPESDRRHEE
jgi:hypothetical protein